MRPPLQFQDDDATLPSRAWANSFVEDAPSYYREVLANYRQRVREFHSEAADLYPEHFRWMNGTELLIVCILTGCWVFARESGSGADEVAIVERWEDPVLASPDTWTAPSHEEFIVRNIDVDLENWTQIGTYDLRNSLLSSSKGPFEARRNPGIWVEGWDLADGDETGREIHRALEGLAGPSMDRLGIREASRGLRDLEGVEDRQRRGLDFETWLLGLLEAHGCEAEKGKHISGEQSDIFIHRPFRAVVETRWRAAPEGVDAVTGLAAKLRRVRPAMVIGIFVSMSGFTSPAHAEANRIATDRVVLLLDRRDVGALTTGDVRVTELVDNRLDVIVRRY